MLFICVTGPNASGKTTMTERLAERYAGRPVLFLHPDTDNYYKQAPPIMFRRILQRWNEDTPVVVMEGTDRPTRAAFQCAGTSLVERQLVIYSFSQPPDVMEAHLRQRCALKGKTYREEYWDRKRLEYEGSRRYPNLVESWRTACGLRPSPPAEYFVIDREFLVNDQAAESIAARIDRALAG